MSIPENLYVYEFLYRGRSDGSEAWHLQLGQKGTDAFGAELPVGPMMTMEQATAAGYCVPEILSAINTQVLAEHEALTALSEAQSSDLTAKAEVITKHESDLAELSEQNSRLIADLTNAKHQENTLRTALSQEKSISADLREKLKAAGLAPIEN